MKHLLLLWLAALAAFAQPLSLPRLGAVRDAESRWRPLNGLAGTLLVGPPQQRDVRQGVSSGSSRSLVQTDAAFLVLDREGQVLAQSPATGDAAILAISADGNTAAAWLPSTSELLYWQANGSQWRRAACSGIDSVLAVAVRTTEALIVLQRGAGYVLAAVGLVDGSLHNERLLPALSGLVQIAPDGSVLWIDAAGLHQFDPAGAQADWPLPEEGIAGFTSIGPSWWQLSGSTGTRWAARLRNGQLDLYELPAGVEQ